MFVRTVMRSGAVSVVLTVVVLSVLGVTDAQVRSSSNYQIQSDSINVGGGLSSSTNYVQESTVGEIATGPSDSTTYSLRAGYQQMQEVFIGLAVSNAVDMVPDLPGITGGTSTGSTTITVTTDSAAGYRLTIAAETDPAMQSGVYTIADYDAGSEPDYSFVTGPSDAHFGFTPEGADIVSRYRDDGGGLCATGGMLDTSQACWDGVSTTAMTIAESTDPTHPNGATTTVLFQVGIGSSVGVAPGVYTATTTVTALAL